MRAASARPWVFSCVGCLVGGECDVAGCLIWGDGGEREGRGDGREMVKVKRGGVEVDWVGWDEVRD